MARSGDGMVQGRGWELSPGVLLAEDHIFTSEDREQAKAHLCGKQSMDAYQVQGSDRDLYKTNTVIPILEMSK